MCKHFLIPSVADFQKSADFCRKGLLLRMDEQAQNVNLFSLIFTGKFYSRHQLNACPAGRFGCFGNARNCVMVSQSDGFQLLAGSQLHNLGRT